MTKPFGSDEGGISPLERTDVLPPARTLAGKYRLGRMLGEGGMGAVYEGVHLGLGSKVAVKILAGHIASNQTSVARFRREARAAAAIKHDNVVSVTDTGTDDEGTPYIVMEYLEGESLSSVLHRERSLSPDMAVPIAAQTLSGLAAAHDREVIHRDLKPPNIFLSRGSDGGYRVKLVDFGISKIGWESESEKLTADGGLVGTPQYMAPEQVKAKPDIDARADLYAVGVLLYRMVTGQLPYMAETADELYEKIIAGGALPPRALAPACPEALEKVILKGMAGDRDARFQDARSFREALYAAMPHLTREGSMLPPPPMHGGDDLPTAKTLELSRPLEGPSGPVTSPARPSASRPSGSRPRPDRAEPRTPASIAPTPLAVGASTARTVRPERRTRIVAAAVAGAAVALAGIVWYTQSGPTDQPRPPAEERQQANGQIDPAPVPSGEPLRFGLTRFLPQEEVEALHAPIARYLERELGRPVVLTVVEDYDDLAMKVVEGEVDLAALSPFTYVRASREARDLRLLATPLIRGRVSSYEGYIVTLHSSGIETLTGLRGHVFCYVSPLSTSGYLYPRALMRRAGMDPDHDFRQTKFAAGDHLRALHMLHDGECDGAAVFASALEDATEHGLPREDFRILASTDRIPYDAYVTPAHVPAEVAARIRRALLALTPGSVLAREVLSEGDIIGFAPVEDSAYDPVRRVEADPDDRGETPAPPPP